MKLFASKLGCRFGQIFYGKRDASRVRSSLLQLEQLEDRYLLAGEPFTVAATEFVLTPQTQSLVQFGEIWKYLDNGSNQGTAWTGLGFNDAAWNAGPAQLGYGDGDEATVVSFGGNASNKFVTTYFRHEFSIADASAIDTLALSLIRDDGAAVYLNGVELLRDGLDPAAAYDKFATAAIDGSAESTPISASIALSQLPAGTLRNGANVLAVEVHQRSARSSDISFDLSVTGQVFGASLIADFNADVDPVSLQAGDLVIDGSLAASSVELLDANTAVFNLPSLLPGSHIARIASGAVADVQQTSIDPFASAFTIAESQYFLKYNPRIQLGDAPLTGFAGSQTDQIELLWQTVPDGNGTQDQFIVDYRLANDGAWTTVSNISQVDLGADQRVNHSAVIAGLSYDTPYEYRVRHLRGSVRVASYESTFRTRLQAGDSSEFSFVAYGDSADGTLIKLKNFRKVQSRINQIGPDFAMLLGDNVYESGTIGEYDARFDPSLSPEAAAWTANHIDYLSIGNHEVTTDGGAPTELNYSVPIPIAGVNAPAAPPSAERLEHNYSFDYGDVHFVTFDSNSRNNAAYLNQLLQYVEADLAASSAKWKIVVVHHPFAAVPNNWTQTDNYYTQVVSRLNAAGVDLVLSGHEHSYSWTYPLLGEAGGQPTFVADTDKSYSKGAGLIQVVVGTGGKSLTSGTFSSSSTPFVAAGFSLTTNPKVEYGFAKLDVSVDQLTVSYIAADDGAVIDSFTINDGFHDANESVTTLEDTVATGNLLAGTSSVNGPVSVTRFTLAGDATVYAAGSAATIAGVGTLVIGGNGDYTFAPVANYNGSVPVATYTVSDGSSTDASTLTISITPVDDAFLDADESITTPENTVAGGNLLTGTSSVDGPVTLTSFALAGSAAIYTAGQTATIAGVGTLVIGSNGDFTFTPVANYHGPVPVATYTVSDGSSTDASTLTISVTPGEPNTLQTVTFQQGVSGYTSTRDTYLRGAFPNANKSTAATLNVDGLASGQPVHALLRFDDIFGSEPGQIPLDANIQSATLVLNVTNSGNSMKLHRLLQAWSDTANWNSFATGGGGIQAGVEAANSADATTSAVRTGLFSIDITASLLQWQTNPASNFGWAFLPTGNNGIDFDSAEGQSPPRLVIEFQSPVADVIYKASIPEESGDGAVVATINAADLGLSGANLSYAITAGDANGGFAIDATGIATIANAGVLDLDFDDGSGLVSTLTVEANDGTRSATANVIVRVTAVNDNPPDAGDDFTATIGNESGNGTAVGSISANDIDLPGDTLTYAIVAGDPDGGFAIDAGGNITIASASVLDLDLDDGSDLVSMLTVQIGDGPYTDTVEVTVRVTPSNPNTLQTVTFQQGVSGYASTRDTYLRGAFPNANKSTAARLNVDGLASGQPVHALLRFDDIFGFEPGQIPLDANIQSATLVLNVTNSGNSMKLHRLLQAWSDTANWNSFATGGGGIQAGVEAANSADATTSTVRTGLFSIDTTASLLQWQTNPASNFGWAFLPTGNNGIDFDSAEGNTPPQLVVEYLVSNAPAAQSNLAAPEPSLSFLQFASSTDATLDAISVVANPKPVRLATRTKRSADSVRKARVGRAKTAPQLAIVTRPQIQETSEPLLRFGKKHHLMVVNASLSRHGRQAEG